MLKMTRGMPPAVPVVIMLIIIYKPSNDPNNIKAKAIDSIGLESDWGTLEVKIPYTYHYSGWQWLCERFPLLLRLLNQLL